MSNRELFTCDSEQKRNSGDNSRVMTLLGGAGLTAVDLQMFDKMQDNGHSVFVHGSVTQNRIQPQSDVDFTIVGRIHEMAPDLRETLMPGFVAVHSLGRKIDYISTSTRSQNGRKISMHISEPGFRDDYPELDTPFATEYRPGIHAKSNAREYFLPGVDMNGTTHLVNFACESERVDDSGGTVTDIPQTGKITLKGGRVFTEGTIEKTNVKAKDVFVVRHNGEVEYRAPEEATQIMILGLEFDKMQSDTSIYGDKSAQQRFVEQPSRRSVEAIGEFTQSNPSAVTGRIMGALAEHWYKIKPNKSR